MNLVTFYQNKVLFNANKVAFGKNCCCCKDGCTCGKTFPTNISNVRTLKVTLGGGSIQYYCFNQLQKESGNPEYVTEMVCVGECNYELKFYTGTCNHTIKLKISNPEQCECNTTDYCELEIIGWDNEPGCPGGGSIVDLEFLDLC